MNDLQQTPALAPPPLSPLPSASFCNSNGGLSNNHNNHFNRSNSSSCFSHSSVSASPLPSSSYPWGTWEDLLLASAVSKHGADNWHTVACELQARAFLVPPSLFSAEACEGRFWILNGRFSSCSNGAVGDGKIPWFEEVRKLRVAQLRRELELYDGSIGMLQKKLNRLKAETGRTESKTSNGTDQLQNLSDLASDKAEGCFEVSSAGDGSPAEMPLGILDEMRAPETVKSSCSSAFHILAGDGRLDATVSANALKEAYASESASCNGSLGSPAMEAIRGQHPTTVKECQLSDSVAVLTSIEVQYETREPQVCSNRILEASKSCQNVEDKGHIQHDTRPSSATGKTFEPPTCVGGTQDNYVSVIGGVENGPEGETFQHCTVVEMENCADRSEQLEDEGIAVKDTVTSDTVLSESKIQRSADVEERGFAAAGTGHLHFCGQIQSSDNVNVTQVKSTQCQKPMASSATLETGTASKEDDHTDECLMSASAMDLLRIAYADGTPVSTPEAAEAQPLEEELNGAKEADSLSPSLIHQSAVHNANLLGCSALNVSCEGIVKELDGELETTEQNKIVETLTISRKGASLNEPISMRARAPDLAFVLETEHMSEPKVCSDEGLKETKTVLFRVTEAPNVKGGSLAAQANTDSSQDMELASQLDLELNNEASVCSEGKSNVVLAPHEEIIKHESQKLKVGKHADNLECCRNSLGKVDLSSDDKACLEMLDRKGEDGLCEECSDQEISCLAKENLDGSSNRVVSNLILLDEPSDCMDKGLDKAIQVVMSGSQPVAEPRKRPGTPIASNSEKSGLSSVEHAPAVYGGLCEVDSQVQKVSPCNSDGRSSVVEAVFLSVNEHQKSDFQGTGPDSRFQADDVCLELSCDKEWGKEPEMVSELKSIQKLARHEEGSVRMLGSKPVSDQALLSPHTMAEDNADKELLEEDGLLVDLMKLKGTDLTNLKKRKYLPKGGSSVDTVKDYEASRERLDEILAHKHPNLPRSQGEDRKARSADMLQNKNSKKLKLDLGAGEYLNQAALSTDVLGGESQDKFRSKDSAVEVFSTRRSRLKSRKLESSVSEPYKAIKYKEECDKKSEDMENDGSVRKTEDIILDAAYENCSRLQVLGLVSHDDKAVIRVENTDNRLLPDLVILLECLRSISGHRFAPLFKLRPEIQGDAKYKMLIKKPMDLNTVRNKLEEGTYSSSLEFFRDMMLIFSNALIFFSRESQEYGAACVLRESLIREMERYLKKKRILARPAAMQTVKCNEMRVLKDFTVSNSTTALEAKRQGSVRSSCDHMNYETDLDNDVDTDDVILPTSLSAKDAGLETSRCVADLDWKKKDRGVKVPGRALSRVKTLRTKTEIEDDRVSISGLKERLPREKQQRILEDGNSKLSMRKESVTLSQESKRPYQISSRPSRDYTAKREMLDKSRSSKYSSGRQVLEPQGRQGEPRKSLVVARSSRSAQQSKQASSRGNHSLSQPQKRAKI